MERLRIFGIQCKNESQCGADLLRAHSTNQQTKSNTKQKGEREEEGVHSVVADLASS
jgi:hypothetical protein